MPIRNERQTQDRVISLFKDQLHYTYLGNLKDTINTNILDGDLRKWLARTGLYTESVIVKAIASFTKSASMNHTDELYGKNKAVYVCLRYGIKIQDSPNILPQTVYLINWDNPEANDFSIAEEVTVNGKGADKRPDLVIYINGIALGVLELKRSSVTVSEGIRQNLDNQRHLFIKPFFSTMQLVLAGNDSQGLYYGTTNTPEKYFLKWKEDGHNYYDGQNILDAHLLQFCEKSRLLDIINNFVLFDKGTKKLCRTNQYFGVKKAQEYYKRKEGGIVWHTQGSGKSLTMVWLAKWILENDSKARVLILTDRTELDEQIESVFKGVDEKIHRTSSGPDLMLELNNSNNRLICSLIHKIGRSDKDEDIMAALAKPKNFSPKGDIVIFIDECHRSQGGSMHDAMKSLLPDALIIGFTGTPLLKTDKQTTLEKFGTFIHTYKFDEAVEDGVVLNLLYEARDVDQHVANQEAVDTWFNIKTRGMNELPKAELKQMWGTMEKLLSTRERLQNIAIDIITDFGTKPRLMEGRGNAILVSNSIYEACRYYKIFQTMGFKECAVITSYAPNLASVKLETTGTGDTANMVQYEIYTEMLAGRQPEKFEQETKKKFIEEPANMKLLIVVDKLLTGFDAPACTYLYIDKEMRDHNLFQAICRVNRTDKEDKEFGYIVDYKNLLKKLGKAISDYTSDALDGFDSEDVKGLLTDRLAKAKERLDDALETLSTLTDPIPRPKQIEQYLEYFLGDSTNPDSLNDNQEKRLVFYKSVVSLIRSYANIASEMEAAGYTPKEAASIKRQTEEYSELRDGVKAASGDYIDLKQYEPEMRQMLDMYLSSDSSRTISNLNEVTLLQLIAEGGIDFAKNSLPNSIAKSPVAMAETLEANVRKVINEELPMNPIYYSEMSELLLDLVNKRRENAIDYEIFLKEMESLVHKVNPESQRTNYPSGVNTKSKQALYDILHQDAKLALALDARIMEVKQDDWIGKPMKERMIRMEICKILSDSSEEEIDIVMELVKHQNEYR